MFLFIIGLACVFPPALYCLYLAMLHQRSRPTMVPGGWDAAGVLIALSGFLLVGGTTVVFAFHTVVRDYWLLGGSLHELREAHARVSAWTFIIWGFYFLTLVGGGAYLIRLRRSCTVVYHVAPAELDDLFDAALVRLNVSSTRRGSRWLLGRANQSTTIDQVVSGDRSLAAETGVVEVEGSEAMRCATLRWTRATGRLRNDLEAILAREVAVFACPPSPATFWLLTAAGVLFMVMTFLLVTFLMATIGNG